MLSSFLLLTIVVVAFAQQDNKPDQTPADEAKLQAEAQAKVAAELGVSVEASAQVSVDALDKAGEVDTEAETKAEAEPGLSQERLDIGCVKIRRPCGPGFVCLPRFNDKREIIPPAVVGAAVVARFEAGKEVAEKIFKTCVARRVLLHKAATVTTVAASITIRMAVGLWAQSAAANINLTLLAARVSWLSFLLGLKADANGCYPVFTADQCKMIEDMKALAALREQDKKAGKPERLAAVTDAELKAFLTEEVTAEHKTQLSVLADASNAENPFKDESEAVKLFTDVKKVNVFLASVETDLKAEAEAERDPIIGATLITGRQFVHLSRYLWFLKAFNGAVAGWDAAHQNEFAKYRATAGCETTKFASVECKAAIVAAMRADYKDIFDAGFKAVQVMEASRIRGAFVVKYVEAAARRTALLWRGVVKCVVVLKAHIARLVVALDVANKIKTGIETHKAKFEAIKENWDTVRAVLEQIATLKAEGKTADDLSDDDKAKLAAAITAIKEARAEVRGDLVKLWVKVQVARSVVCRRRLKKFVAFKLRGICRAKELMGDAECKERVENYFNGLRDKILENKDKIAAFKEEHLKCWPLIRFQINARVALGAAAVAALGSGDGENDGVLDRIDSSASNPCNTVDGEACEETSGKLWIPKDCTAPPAEPEASGDDESDADVAETDPAAAGTRKRSVLEVRMIEAEEEATANEFQAMMAVDGNSEFTVEDDEEVNVESGDEFVVAVDDSLAPPPDCVGYSDEEGCENTAGPSQEPGTTPQDGNTPVDGSEDSGAASLAVSALFAVVLVVAL